MCSRGCVICFPSLQMPTCHTRITRTCSLTPPAVKVVVRAIPTARTVCMMCDSEKNTWRPTVPSNTDHDVTRLDQPLAPQQDFVAVGCTRQVGLDLRHRCRDILPRNLLALVTIFRMVAQGVSASDFGGGRFQSRGSREWGGSQDQRAFFQGWNSEKLRR